jgi:hypothetical protein
MGDVQLFETAFHVFLRGALVELRHDTVLARSLPSAADRHIPARLDEPAPFAILGNCTGSWFGLIVVGLICRSGTGV